ncbi:hypothetical protein [Anaerococcus murdochii]|uniref:hypothetical protein n=1 Tax=Anaerococcus murdochii TaxID=411577 RepID=UPI001CC17248|nr:hypothetical protein [Anaerococcus murdochii]
MKVKHLLITGLITIALISCNHKTNNNNSTNEELLKRIGELEEENKKLKSQLESSNEDNSNSSENLETVSTDITQNETKIIGGEEKGEGDIILRTPGGEGKDVILIVNKNTSMTSIDLDAKNVDINGNEPTRVYIDGKENTTLQLSKDVYSQNMLTLEKDLLSKGKHIVEVIQEINGEQTFYRQLTYTVKN